jgi:predicted PurR-regulated permease PerM
METRRERVPVRTILAAIGLVLATFVVVEMVIRLQRVLVWIIVSAFLAMVFAPAVGWVERRIRVRRTVATFLVFLLGLLIVIGLAAAFVIPLANQASHIATTLPDQVREAQSGRGPVADLLRRLNLYKFVESGQANLQTELSRLGAPALGVAKTLINTIAGLATIFVLSYLMVLQGPRLVDGTLNLMNPQRAHRVRHVATDCGRAVTGYMTGNLLISVICGVVMWVPMLVTGVPFAGVIALFVGVVDLLPLVGATIGGVVAIGAGFLHSLTAGIVIAVVLLVYQQAENHLLQPIIMSRTVQLNPLAVLVSVLLGAELAGILGALLAIPVASMIQIIVRDIWDTRRGELKSEPTVGEDQTPVGQQEPYPMPVESGSRR